MHPIINPMKLILILIADIIFAINLHAQKYSTKTGQVSFYSKAPLEDIKADNRQGSFVLDASTGEVAAVVLIKSFEFRNSLMQEHFNDNYMESDKYPKSTFIGKISNIQDVKFDKEGTYDVKVSGQLTIHGVTKEITEIGKISVKGDVVMIESVFLVTLADFGIKNDKVKNIAERIEVTVNAELKKK